MQATDAPGKEGRSTFANASNLLLDTTLAILAGALSGSLSAFFLWSLDLVNLTRISHPSLLFGLPAVGLLVFWSYRRFGGVAANINNIILSNLNGRSLPGERVPVRTIPLILVGSVLSQLFGASTGREGAAVQMGASGATLLQRLLRVPVQQHLDLLRCGVAAGFASIFGTPVAGAVFAIEAPRPGSPALHALPLTLAASYAGHLTCLAWGASHALYSIQFPALSNLLELKMVAGIVFSSIAFGCAASLFIKTLSLVHKTIQTSRLPRWSAPLLGGSVLLGLGSIPGMEDYLGLGVHKAREGATTLSSAFHIGGATDFSWLSKLLFTSVSLGSGFKGGEVTPLFFTGATLGNTIASHFNLPVPLFAGLGFVCVFTGAAHTPLAGIAIAIELFGPMAAPFFAPACWIAHKICITPGIYPSQAPLDHRI